MKKIIFILCSFLILNTFAVSQKRNSVRKPAKSTKSVVKKEIPVKSIVEIPAAEWSELAKLLEVQDWDKASAVAERDLKRLKEENELKQLAQLNYIYLFSLAGKVSVGSMTIIELKNIAQTMIGKSFIMFNRKILDDCANSLNFVCPDKGDKFGIKVAATNKDFTLIHSFEYVKLLQEFDFVKNKEKNVYVGGKLTKVEVNEKPDKVWIMRLFFNEGWAQIIET